MFFNKFLDVSFSHAADKTCVDDCLGTSRADYGGGCFVLHGFNFVFHIFNYMFIRFTCKEIS